MKLRTVIIDDEHDSVSLLQLQLAQCCEQVEVVATYNSSVKALHEIEILQPDLLFLDVEMPVMNGFDLLNNVLLLNFSVIFITAYNQYALKAFRFNALDFLIKPIDTTELVEAVEKAKKKIKPTTTQLSLMQRQLAGELPTKIAIPGQKGVFFHQLRWNRLCGSE